MARVVDALALTEAHLLADVRREARAWGFRVYHTKLSWGSDPGFPDVVLVRPPRVIFAELKNDTRRPSDDQIAWLDLLAAVPGAEVYLWRPAHWPEIAALLISDDAPRQVGRWTVEGR